MKCVFLSLALNLRASEVHHVNVCGSKKLIWVPHAFLLERFLIRGCVNNGWKTEIYSEFLIGGNGIQVSFSG